jgi:hypothetical protein
MYLGVCGVRFPSDTLLRRIERHEKRAVQIGTDCEGEYVLSPVLMAWGLLREPSMKNQWLIRIARRGRSADMCRLFSMKGRSRQATVWTLSLVLLVSPFIVSPGNGSEIPEWPQERDERLSVVESQILDVQRKLFSARLHNEEEKREELEKQMKELEREQVKLLRASGYQFPPQ